MPTSLLLSEAPTKGPSDIPGIYGFYDNPASSCSIVFSHLKTSFSLRDTGSLPYHFNMMRCSLRSICALLAANCMNLISAIFPGSYYPANSSSLCRNLPGDDLWPSTQTWTDLNTTVEGRLIRTTPLGAPCHDPTYDESKCAALKHVWVYPQT